LLFKFHELFFIRDASSCLYVVVQCTTLRCKVGSSGGKRKNCKMPNYFHYYYSCYHETIMHCRICCFIFQISWIIHHSRCFVDLISYMSVLSARRSSGGKRQKCKIPHYFHYCYYNYHETVMNSGICLFVILISCTIAIFISDAWT
jgi:hypothetical protein